MIVYAIRHVATKEIMPQLRGKGYSWWNPAIGDIGKTIISKSTGLPRLFKSERAAKSAISGWFITPNSRMKGYTTSDGENDYEIYDKPDGRKKEDLEIIQFELTEHWEIQVPEGY